MEVLDYVFFAVQHLVTPDDVCRKIMKADKKYGKFDAKEIQAGVEALEEILDLFAYVHISKYQGAPL